MKCFEYKISTFQNQELTKYLNLLGQEGWELIAMRSLFVDEHNEVGWIVGTREFIECTFKKETNAPSRGVYNLPPATVVV